MSLVNLTSYDWHSRFKQQAKWTQNIRDYIFSSVELDKTKTILEVGCGSGVISDEVFRFYNIRVTGLDIDQQYLKIAADLSNNTKLINGDAYSLPLVTDSFNITYCHFFLMWLDQPINALEEMIRVTKPGGSIMALAEPDYGGRIDYPPKLAEMGKLQAQSLFDQGADPYIGRRVPEFFTTLGLVDIRYGVLGGQWNVKESDEGYESEWMILNSDLVNKVSQKTLAEYREVDYASKRQGTRILYVPTFYAWGFVPV